MTHNQQNLANKWKLPVGSWLRDAHVGKQNENYGKLLLWR